MYIPRSNSSSNLQLFSKRLNADYLTVQARLLRSTLLIYLVLLIRSCHDTVRYD